MNVKIIAVLRNFSYALLSNFLSLLISSLVILVIPKVIGVKDYGYWQLYLFYVSYVGFLHFGWNDGIYLRYGGERYGDLNKKIFFSQYIMLAISQLLMSISIIILITIFERNTDKTFIYQMIGFNIFIVNVKTMFLYILQATYRIKEYSFVTIIDRILYLILIVIVLVLKIGNYQVMIWADVFGKIISLFLSMYYCREIVRQRLSNFSLNLTETKENLSVGVKLMFANIASLLVLGIVRFGIEKSWNVSTFGKISLTLSVSNMMMIFINALGIIMFPILRNTDENKLPRIYEILRDFTMVILFAVLTLYFPLRFILSLWLPQYADSLKYMALLFPMIIFEGKASLLINTYLKTLRQEKIMLLVNIITVLLSIFLTLITTVLLQNLDLTILSIVALLGFRCTLTEVKLAYFLDINVNKDIVLEWGLSIVFIALAWFLYSGKALLIYLCIYFVYIFIKRKDIKQSYYNMKSMI